MTVALSSLRVVSEFDASAYTRGMAEKVAADKAGAASSVAVATAIRTVDTAVAATGGALGQLSRAYVDGYGTQAKFEKGVRDLGRALESGNASSAQASAIYTAMAQRLGLVANAGDLAAKGQIGLASVVTKANAAILAQNEMLTRNAAATKNASASADLQKTFGFTSQADKTAQSMRQLFGVVREGDPAFVALKGTVEGSTRAHEAHGHAVVGNYMAMQESQHVIQAFTDVILAGGSPLQAMKFELSRIAEIVSSPGGVNNLFQAGQKYIGGYATVLTSLANPITLVAGGLVGMGAAAVYAFNAWDERLNRLQTSLNGLGRSTGLTLGGLNQLAISSAGGRTSSSQAAQAITAFAATGQIGPTMMGRLTAPQAGQSQGLVQQFSQATGESYSDSYKKLAADLASPTKGAEELNKQFGLLDDNQMQIIKHLDASGQKFEAQGAILDALAPRIQHAADVTSIWAMGWNSVEAAASKAIAVAGRFVDPTLEDKLARARAAAQSGSLGGSFFNPFRASDQERQTGSTLDQQTLQEMVDRRSNSAVLAAMDQTASEKSRDIGDITRRVNPDIDRQQKLIDDLAKLQEAMATPGALGKTDPKAAQEAVDRLNAEVKNFGTAAQIVARDSASATAATMAQTATQRTAIEATKAWNDVVRAGGGYALAAAESTAKWNAAIAETKRALDDETRSVATRHAEIGMNPMQREQYEIYLKGNASQRNAVQAPDVTSPGGWPIGGVSALDRAMTAKLTNRATDVTTPNPFGVLEPPTSTPTYKNWADAAASATAPHAGAPWTASAAGYPAAGALNNRAQNVSASVGDVALAKMDEITRSSQLSLDAANRSLDTQKATWGQLPGPIAAANESLRLYNEEVAWGGKAFADSMAKQNDGLAKQAGLLATNQAAMKQYTDTLASARSGFSDLAQTLGSDIVAHKSWKDIGTDLSTSLSQKAMSAGMDQLTNGLFGQPSQGGGGGLIGSQLSGILGPLFGVNPSAATTSAQVFNAQTLNVGMVSGIGGALSNLTGGGASATPGGGIGGWFSSLFGGGSSPLAGSSALGQGGIGHNASGGFISGPGGPRSDSIPSMLSNGEYIVNANSTSRYRPLLDHINYRGYADGGPVVPMRSAPIFGAPSVQSDNAPISVHITNNHPTGQVESVKQSRDPSGGRRLDLTFSDATAGAMHSPAGRQAMAAYGVSPPLIKRG